MSSFKLLMSDAPSSQSSRIAVVDDTDPSMVFVGTWSHDQGISGIATPYEEKNNRPSLQQYGDVHHIQYLSLRFQFQWYVPLGGPTGCTLISDSLMLTQVHY